MTIDVLMVFHLIFYPIITGALMVAVALNLYNGNRWVVLSLPSLIIMLILTLNTHANYQGYML